MIQTASLLVLSLLALIMPWEENFYLVGLPSLARVLGLVALGLGICKVISTGRMRTVPWPMLWFALYIVWCFLAVSWSIKPEATLSRAITYILLFTFVWLIWELADTPARQKWILRAVVIGTAVLVFNVYLKTFVGRGVALATEERATADSANPNGVAAACCSACQFALYLITRREKGRFELPSWVYWAFIAAAGIVIPLTGSRAGFAAAAVTSIAFISPLWQATRKSGWKNAAMFGIVILAIAVMVPRLASRSVLMRLTEGFQSNTFQERADAWERGYQEWKKTPLLGIGPGTYRFAGVGLRDKERVAHNTFVSVFVESGVVGTVLYFGFWVLILVRVFHMPKNDRLFWLIFLASFMPTMTTASGEYAKYWWLIGALILCQSANPKPAPQLKRRPGFYPLRRIGPALGPPGPSTT